MNAYDFRGFALAIANNFDQLTRQEAFRVAIDGDTLWQAYLAAFPAGTNEIYRKRTYHDGSYDRNFIRQVGNVVAIRDGKLVSLWQGDFQYPYDVVAAKLQEMVENAPIQCLFRTKEPRYGYESTVEQMEGGVAHRWHHFHCKVPISKQSGRRSVGDVVGEVTTNVGVMKRSLDELTLDAVNTVLELIEQNTLYRGAEFKQGLDRFLVAKLAWESRTDEERNIYLWDNCHNRSLMIRNTAIGQFLQDLSEGKDLEASLRSYERMVAPTNYRRPTAAITPKMVEQAMETIRDLGLEDALQRRHARLSDVSINDVLWADNSTQRAMKDSLESMLLAETRPTTVNKGQQDIGIQDFLTQVLPQAKSMEAWFSNPLQGNLMSLTAPVHPDAGQLFNWGNNFAWSYNGNITDSIKEKVKAAGGNVEADLRVSLAWSNYDDLDLHCILPNRTEVFYANKQGILDVDMNAGGARQSRSPVENLAFVRPRDGIYQIKVNNYYAVERDNQGFTLEVACDGVVNQYSYPNNSVKQLDCLMLKIHNGKLVDTQVLNCNISGQGISQTVWGIPTEQFVRVQTRLHSPNHWEGEQTGNKHWFFILEGCQNPDPVRGIYNEFLKPELAQHRKVFEVLGNKTKCPVADEQLSGLGFSSTQRNQLLVRVTTEHATQLYNVQF